MRNFYSVAAIATMTAALAACGAQSEAGPVTTSASSPTTTSATSTAPPSPAWTGDVIPDGTYTKSETMADALALGITRKAARQYFGRDDTFRLMLKIDGDNFAQFSDDDGETMAQGDGGTFTYDADGNWVATSASTGCPRCVATVDWSFKGDRLTLTLLDSTEGGDPVNLLVSRLVIEGEWTRR